MKIHIGRKLKLIKRIKINEKHIIYLLLIIPFFQLYSIDLLMNKGILHPLMYGIDRIFAVARWGITAIVLIDSFQRQEKLGVVTKGIIVFSLLRCLSIIVNRDFGIGVIIGNITYISFAILLERLIKYNNKLFIDVNRVFFGIVSFISIATNIIFPYGFLFSEEKHEAVYFLGSKNSGFYYYVLFLFFLILTYIVKENKLPVRVLLFAFFCALGAYATSSANTLLCIVVIIAYLFFVRIIENNVNFFEAKKLFFVLLVFSCIILFGKELNIINSFLELFGRNATFTGRDYIWEQNIKEYLQTPLWGVGYEFEVLLRNDSYVNHAHNFFLDNLVKYGIIEFISLLMILMITIKNIVVKKEKRLLAFYSIIFFVVILHSLFDDLSIYTLTIVFVAMEKVGERKKTNWRYILWEKNG